MTTPPADGPRELLLQRIRATLSGEQLRERRMFGLVALMSDDTMLVAAHKDGSLLARVDPAEDASLLAIPHSARAEMGKGRSMGEGWIRVDAAGLRTDEELGVWLQAATGYLKRRTGARQHRPDMAGARSAPGTPGGIGAVPSR